MPRLTRDEKKAAREAAGLRFRQWAQPIVKASGLGNTEIANRAQELARRSGDENGGFDKSAVSHWLDGLNVPEPRNALLFARALDADPIDALHAAGHDYLIETLVEIIKAHDAAKARGEDPTGTYRDYLDDASSEPEARGSAG
jgi:hypothetical protein